MPTFSDNPALSPSSSRGFSRFRRNPLLLDLEQRINPAKGGGGEVGDGDDGKTKVEERLNLLHPPLPLIHTHFPQVATSAKNLLRAL